MLVGTDVRGVDPEHDQVRLHDLDILDDRLHEVLVDVRAHLALEGDGVDHGQLVSGLCVRRGAIRRQGC